MSDPSILTKAKLKEELKLHNIPLPKSDSLKKVYVDLYRKHILQEEDEHSEGEISAEERDLSEEENSSEYSNSDEIVIVPQKITQQKKSKKNIPKKQTEEVTNKIPAMADVKELTNAALAEELKLLGMSPGPIMATTRSVYEKKLIKLRQEKGEVPLDYQVETTQYEEVPDDEEKTPSPPPKPSPGRKPRLTAEGTALTRRKLASIRSEPAPEGIDRSSGPESLPIQQPTETKEKHGAPVWIKLLILAILCFFVYLVYINMEPSSGSKVPEIINK